MDEDDDCFIVRAPGVGSRPELPDFVFSADKNPRFILNESTRRDDFVVTSAPTSQAQDSDSTFVVTTQYPSSSAPKQKRPRIAPSGRSSRTYTRDLSHNHRFEEIYPSDSYGSDLNETAAEEERPEPARETNEPLISRKYELYSESVMSGSAGFYRIDDMTYIIEEWNFEAMTPLVRILV
jgi:hypothetical protein